MLREARAQCGAKDSAYTLADCLWRSREVEHAVHLGLLSKQIAPFNQKPVQELCYAPGLPLLEWWVVYLVLVCVAGGEGVHQGHSPILSLVDALSCNYGIRQ